jgi:serine/threonine-protein kinase
MGERTSPQIVGRYAIYGKIASGGMASVHFGRLLGGAGFSRTVAIKRLHPHLAEDPEFLSTMIDEARLVARIHHPNVVPTLDVVAADGELLLVMEYVRGESLARLAKVHAALERPVPSAVTAAIVVGALHGLHAAHEATSEHGAPLGIIHRDVSPQNILVGIDGMARVIDFGVAKAAGRLQTTREGTIKGKIAYMAPEQLSGAQVTRAADIYSMGVVLWETLTGRRLFPGDSDAAVMGRVLAGSPDPPSRHAPDVPAALDALVLKALARNPADRFSTARDMAESLNRIIPPARATEVGDWCAQVAREGLARRGLLLAEIESSSWVAPVPRGNAEPGMTPNAQGSGTSPLEQPHPEETLPETISPEQQVAPSAPRVESTPTGEARWAVSRRSVGGAVAAVAVLASLAAALWYARSSAMEGASPTQAVPLTIFSAPPLTPPTLPDAPPSAISTTAPTTSAPALPPPPAVRVPPPREGRPSVAAPKPKSAADCNPNFYYDSNGDKHFKPACFPR